MLVGSASLAIAVASIFVASSDPDAIERIEQQLGGSAAALLASPLADYRLSALVSEHAGQAIAAIIGLALVYFACVLVGRMIAKPGRT